MAERPSVKPGDWIRIGSGNVDGVISRVYLAEDVCFGDCEAVHNPSKPTNEDVKWTGEQWEFALKGPNGGYADKYDRLRPYLRILKAVRWGPLSNASKRRV